MTDQASTGDPRRSMELLWGLATPATRGPKASLTLETIVTAAIELADAEGMGAVSMRRVAEQVGKSPMSLYTYVPSKAELVDLMLDTVYGEVRTEHPLEGGWRPAVEAAARDYWDLFERHPWSLQVSGSRAILGPHELDVYETHLRLFDGLGLTEVELARAANVLGGFVWGAARAIADARTAAQVTGVSDEEWWAARSPFLEELAGPAWDARYPTMSRLDALQVFDPTDGPEATTPYLEQEALDAFEFGLQRLLDGIEALVTARTG